MASDTSAAAATATATTTTAVTTTSTAVTTTAAGNGGQSDPRGDIPLTERSVASGVVLTLISAASVGANLYLCLTIAVNPNLSSFCNDLVLCLAVIDLVIAAVLMPFTAYTMFAGRWEFSETACEALGAFTSFILSANVFTLCVIGYIRYLRVCNFRAFYRRLFRIYLAYHVLGIVLAASLITLPVILDMAKVKFIPGLYMCLPTSPIYVGCFIGLTYATSAVVLLAFYLKVYLGLKRTLPVVLRSCPNSFDMQIPETWPYVSTGDCFNSGADICGDVNGDGGGGGGAGGGTGSTTFENGGESGFHPRRGKSPFFCVRESESMSFLLHDNYRIMAEIFSEAVQKMKNSEPPAADSGDLYSLLPAVTLPVSSSSPGTTGRDGPAGPGPHRGSGGGGSGAGASVSVVGSGVSVGGGGGGGGGGRSGSFGGTGKSGYELRGFLAGKRRSSRSDSIEWLSRETLWSSTESRRTSLARHSDALLRGQSLSAATSSTGGATTTSTTISGGGGLDDKEGYQPALARPVSGDKIEEEPDDSSSSRWASPRLAVCHEEFETSNVQNPEQRDAASAEPQSPSPRTAATATATAPTTTATTTTTIGTESPTTTSTPLAAPSARFEDTYVAWYGSDKETGRSRRRSLPIFVHKLDEGVTRRSSVSPAFQSPGASFMGVGWTPLVVLPDPYWRQRLRLGEDSSTDDADNDDNNINKASAAADGEKEGGVVVGKGGGGTRRRRRRSTLEPVLKEEMKLGATLAAVMLSFLLPFFPIALLSSSNPSHTDCPVWLLTASLLVAFCHVTLNPFVYGWGNVRIRRVVVNRARARFSGCRQRCSRCCCCSCRCCRYCRYGRRCSCRGNNDSKDKNNRTSWN